MRRRAPFAVAVLVCAVVAHAQVDDVEPAARAAFDAVRTRCPSLALAPCCSTPSTITAGTSAGDRVTLTRECSWLGNGGEGRSQETIAIDLASCRATCAVEEWAGTSSWGTFDAFGLSEPALSPPPVPPGEAYRETDPRQAAVRLLLTASAAPSIEERAGLAIGSFAASASAAAGRPTATPAVFLTAPELRSIGVPPRTAVQSPEGARPLRAYRLTAAMAAPTEMRTAGDHVLMQTEHARCLAVWHRATDTHHWLHCFEAPGRITWIASDDVLAVGRYVADESAFADQEYADDGSPVVTTIVVAVLLEQGRLVTIDPAGASSCTRATTARERDGRLTLRRCRASASLTLAELGRALAPR